MFYVIVRHQTGIYAKSIFKSQHIIGIMILLVAVFYMLRNKIVRERFLSMLMGSLLFIILINLHLIQP